MAKLKDIKGSAIQYLAEDPVEYVGSWSAGGNLNGSKSNATMSGIVTASIIASGEDPPGTNINEVEQYDGTSWTETTEVNTARRLLAGAGTTTANLIYGGYVAANSALTENWNGSAWTEVADLNTARRSLAGAGTNTAALAITGLTTADVANMESYNGTSWSETTDVNTARRSAAGVGISTAALIAGGSVPPNYQTKTESWDGSSWTEVNDLNQARIGGMGGTYTSALFFGGYVAPAPSSLTESWNGTNWTEVNNLSTARDSLQGSGANNTSALAAGGNPSTATEEWTAADFEIKTMTTS